MQLLKITTVPIKYKEEKRVVVNTDTSFSLENIEKNSSNIQIPVANVSNSRNDNKSNIKQEISSSQPAVYSRGTDGIKYETASETDENEYSVSYCYGKKNIALVSKYTCSAAAQNIRRVSIDSVIDNIDSVIPDKSWEPKIQSEKQESVNKEKSETYKTVEEFAHVEIEYMGGFNYFPKSSDPDYEEPEEK